MLHRRTRWSLPLTRLLGSSTAALTVLSQTAAFHVSPAPERLAISTQSWAPWRLTWKGNESTVLDSSISHYREVMATNLDGVYYCARAAGLHWRRQAKERTTIDGKKLEDFQKGSFVATASMSGHIVNFPHIQTAYNASKAGVIHMCKTAISPFLYCKVNMNGS